MPWVPSTNVVQDWGTFKVHVAGTDRTFFRGAPVVIDEFWLTDPYGHGPARLRWPSVTPFDAPGSGDTAWLDKHARVDIWRADPDTGELLGVPVWSGFIASLEVDTAGWAVHCAGAMSGFLAAQCHQPSIIRRTIDVGYLLSATMKLWSRPFGRYEPYEGAATGVTTQRRGNRSMTVLQWVDLLLELLTESDGTQYTILPDASEARVYRLQERDLETVFHTVHIGAPGVDVRLSRDCMAEVNRIFGEGVTPPDEVHLGGSRWRNAKYPNLGQETVPQYPFDDESSFGVGTVDDDTDTGNGILALVYELWSDGHLSYADRQATRLEPTSALSDRVYTQAVADAVERVQAEAGLPVTGEVDTATWDAVWGDGENAQNLNSAHFAPLAKRSATEPYLYSGNGSIYAENPAADWSVMRVERFVSFGESTSKAEATRLAAAEIARLATPRYYGTITLTADPEEGSRFAIKAGDNIELRGLAGDTVFHVSGVVVRPGTDAGMLPSVELKVDTHGRPLPIMLAQLMKDHQRHMDPAYQLSKSKANNTADALVGWDAEAGAGAVYGDNLSVGWNVIKIVGADAGFIRRIDLQTKPAREFAVALFGRPVTKQWLYENIDRPLDEDFNFTDLDQDVLDAYELVEFWGDHNSPMGYWPKDKGSEGDTPPLTGRGRDDGNWSFYSRSAPWLYLAVYVSGPTDLTGQITHQVVEGE